MQKPVAAAVAAVIGLGLGLGRRCRRRQQSAVGSSTLGYLSAGI